jgi:hypothetical protein
VPQSWLKVLWGLGVGAGAYLALRRLPGLAGGRQLVAEAIAWLTSSCSTRRSCARSSPASATRSTARLARGGLRAIRPRFADAARRRRLAARRLPGAAPDSGMGGGIGQWLLFRAGDGSLSLFALVVPPGAQTPVHDHLAWGLVGLYRGTQDEEVYARSDGGCASPSAARSRRATSTRSCRRATTSTACARRRPSVGLDPPADERHGLRLAPRLRPGDGRARAFRSGYVNAPCAERRAHLTDGRRVVYSNPLWGVTSHHERRFTRTGLSSAAECASRGEGKGELDE